MRWSPAYAVGCLLVASALALASAPLLMPDSYSWLEHTTSESAAQGVDGAWLARLGFVLLGLAVLVLVATRRDAWGRAGSVLHAGFGLLMIATAAFPSRSWVPDARYDPVADVLHSVAATGVGFAFALGVVAVLWHAQPAARRTRWPLDAFAVAASVAVPLAMVAVGGLAGLLQRAMFLVAFAWYGVEALRRR
jgi:hypothetical protein